MNDDLLAHESIDENVRFLILEVSKQLERTREYFVRRTPKLAQRILARDDYIDNLKAVIQRKVLTLASEVHQENPAYVHLLNSVDVVTINLERIADFCGNVLSQLEYVEEEAILRKIDFAPFFEEVIGGMRRIERALFGRDVQEAIQICRSEAVLDDLYVSAFRKLLEELKDGKNAQSLVTTIFISHYFERMGDSLLNIGEAIISACLGEPIKIGQFNALEDSLTQANLAHDVDGVALESFTETQSGHRVARVSRRQEGDPGRMVIFKEGRVEKLREERDSIASWEGVAEGLAPKVYSFHERGETGAILFEYLPGRTFEEVLLKGDQREVDLVVSRITATLGSVWQKTRKEQAIHPRFVEQLMTRLRDLYAVHPEFRGGGGNIGSIRVLGFEELIERARPLDERLVAPFSVFIHGDFNADNVIYDGVQDRVRFIDLHRSRHMDYVQDLSVFLVSCFRLQVFRAPVRRRIRHAIRRFFRFSEQFAAEQGDDGFSARLALGLARSFATSTRFVLDPAFAKTMMLKSRYLLERLVACDPSDLRSFEIAGDVLLD